MTDVLAALIQILKSDVDVSALAGAYVYGEEMDSAINTLMPRKCIMIRSAGGLLRTKTDTLNNSRFDVFCYGEDPYEAKVLGRTVYTCLTAVEREAIVDVLIHSIGVSGGPLYTREPDTKWPLVLMTINVNADERAIV